jgi:hypothetical protein
MRYNLSSGFELQSLPPNKFYNYKIVRKYLGTESPHFDWNEKFMDERYQKCYSEELYEVRFLIFYKLIDKASFDADAIGDL